MLLQILKVILIPTLKQNHLYINFIFKVLQFTSYKLFSGYWLCFFKNYINSNFLFSKIRTYIIIKFKDYLLLSTFFLIHIKIFFNLFAFLNI